MPNRHRFQHLESVRIRWEIFAYVVTLVSAVALVSASSEDAATLVTTAFVAWLGGWFSHDLWARAGRKVLP